MILGRFMTKMIPANSVTILNPDPQHGMGLFLIPNRSVEIHRDAFLFFIKNLRQKRRTRLVRYIGVDLHKTNFVVCFLNEDETFRLESFPHATSGNQSFHVATE